MFVVYCPEIFDFVRVFGSCIVAGAEKKNDLLYKQLMETDGARALTSLGGKSRREEREIVCAISFGWRIFVIKSERFDDYKLRG